MSEQDNSDRKEFIERIMKHRKPMTKDDCHEYLEAGGEDMLLGYKDGVYGSTAALQGMLDTAQDYDELKTELSNFVAQQKELLAYISDTWPGETVEEFKKSFKEINPAQQVSLAPQASSKPSST